MVDTCSVLASSHVRVPSKWNQSETTQNSKKQRLWERLKLFWTSHMSGYPMNPIKPSGTSKIAKKVQNGKKGSFKRRLQFWRTFFKVMGKIKGVLDFSHVRNFFETNYRKWGLQRSFQECQKRPKMAKRVIFKEDSSLDAFIILFLSPHCLWLVPSATLKCE